MKKFVLSIISFLAISFIASAEIAPTWISIGLQMPIQNFYESATGKINGVDKITFQSTYPGCQGTFRVNWNFEKSFYFGIDASAGGMFYSDNFFILNINTDFGYWKDFSKLQLFIGGFIGYEFQTKAYEGINDGKLEKDYRSLALHKGNVGADLLVNFKLSNAVGIELGCKAYFSIGSLYEKSKQDKVVKKDKQGTVEALVITPSVGFVYNF